MPRLPGIGQKQAERALAKAGFEIIRQGKHVTMSDGVRIVQLPRHNPINSFTMGKIAKDAGFTPDEFKKLL
jgi:predicted RNA binding protein YcfA (HicA-like mRNA interferase family)